MRPTNLGYHESCEDPEKSLRLCWFLGWKRVPEKKRWWIWQHDVYIWELNKKSLKRKVTKQTNQIKKIMEKGEHLSLHSLCFFSSGCVMLPLPGIHVTQPRNLAASSFALHKTWVSKQKKQTPRLCRWLLSSFRFENFEIIWANRLWFQNLN